MGTQVSYIKKECSLTFISKACHVSYHVGVCEREQDDRDGEEKPPNFQETALRCQNILGADYVNRVGPVASLQVGSVGVVDVVDVRHCRFL